MKHPRIRLLAMSMFGLAIASTAAHAQMAAPGSPPGMNNVIGAPPPTVNPDLAKPPPALPGARRNPDLVTPADKSADLSPNDALFDAINRGDIGSARDALNHGADLDAHNVLGMTPLDLSIDLSRNDISFLLLSMRGGSATTKAPPAATAASLAKAKAERQKTQADDRRAAALTAKQQAVAVKATPAAQTPRLFAGDGGAPRPDAGFLGFDEAK